MGGDFAGAEPVSGFCGIGFAAGCFAVCFGEGLRGVHAENTTTGCVFYELYPNLLRLVAGLECVRACVGQRQTGHPAGFQDASIPRRRRVSNQQRGLQFSSLYFGSTSREDKRGTDDDKSLPYVSGAEFFGDRNRISYYQSVTALTLARNHSKGKTATGDLLVIADPVYSENEKRDSKAPKKGPPRSFSFNT